MTSCGSRPAPGATPCPGIARGPVGRRIATLAAGPGSDEVTLRHYLRMSGEIRPVLGASLSLNNADSWAWAGINYHVTLLDPVFFEFTLGGVVHNGYLENPPEGREPPGLKSRLGPSPRGAVPSRGLYSRLEPAPSARGAKSRFGYVIPGQVDCSLSVY